MADAVPLISVSAEAEDENLSLSDSEEANKAKTMIAARMRRRQKQKRKPAEQSQGRPTLTSLIIDDGDESGLTDVETVECDHDGGESSNNSKSSSPVEDFTPIFDAVLQPAITQIIDDHEGNTHVSTMVKGVIATLDDSDLSNTDDEDENEPKLSLVEALTDVEDFEDSGDESEARSDNSEMNKLIGQLELGGDVSTSNQEAESAGRPSTHYQPKSSSMLLCPKSAAGRKKTRKTRTKKKATSSASQPLLTVGNSEDPLTDVESISGVEDFESHSGGSASGHLMVLHIDRNEDEGATDVEDFRFSDNDESKPSITVCLTPGITVTGETSETESYDCSGRSSRLGLTDVESVSGMEDDNYVPPPIAESGLLIPQNADDPVTDVEDIDNVEEEAPSPAPVIPRNGPALHGGQQHVVTIQEDEHGRVTSRKYTGSPGLLGFVDSSQREEGVSDTEYINVSEEEHGDDDQSRGVTPEIEMFVGSTVRVKRHSLSMDPEQQEDVEDNEPNHSASHYSLMPPVTATEILTDTEDMDMSDNEMNQGQKWIGRL